MVGHYQYGQRYVELFSFSMIEVVMIGFFCLKDKIKGKVYILLIEINKYTLCIYAK